MRGAAASRGAAMFVATALLAFAPSAAAEQEAVVRRVVCTGLVRVRSSVVEEILPRALPAVVTDAEIAELERRLWSLAIFDDVAVGRERDAITVRVREKWTLVPSIDFGTSKTLRDSYLYGSLAEVNLGGRAEELGIYAAYAERALSAEVWWGQHQAAARRFSLEAGAYWVGSGIFFPGTAWAWERRRTGARAALRLPFAYGTRVRFAVLASAYREVLDGELPSTLGDGNGGAFGLRVVWDRYAWNDVVPAGARLTVEATPGALVPDGRAVARPRHAGLVQMLAALPLGSTTVVAGNVVAEGVAPGDPNHSALLGNVPGFRFSIGSLGGVRGLPDNVLRDAAHAYVDLELRHALTLRPRWYLQGIAFVDAGVYGPMDELGRVRPATGALSTGLGVRLLPTAIAALVPRLDGGRVHAPRGAWFVTFGLSQYF